MAEIRNRNTVQVNEAGKQKLIEGKAAKRNYEGKLWTYLDIAEASGVGEKTVKRFFAGQSVDLDNAIAIATALNLELAELIDPKESNPPDATPENSIDWRDICHKMLEEQLRRYQFRRQATGTGLGHEVGIYVPLGLVKPTTQPRRSEEFCPSPDEGRLQYQLNEKEIEKRFEADAFLREVIEAGEGKTIAIIGEPGAGKSTWLEQIARHLKNSENVSRLPICIQLGSLDGKTLEEYLLQVWLKEALSLQGMVVSAQMQTELMQLFNSHQVWLLLDGVDEIRADTSTGANSPLQGIANQLRGWVAQAQTLLTCRLNVWQANDRVVPNCDIYRTLDFDDSQVVEFIGEWFAKAGKPQLGKQLREKLGESGRERIRDLIRNPLRLALLCQTWAVKQGELPKTKAMLYQRFREDFYEWKAHPLLTEDLDKQDELHEAFGKLALEAINKKLPLRKRFVHKVMGKSLFKLATESGWLNEVYCDAETDEPVYAFWHLTFQEYFAALAIDDWHFFLTHDNDNPQPLPGNVYRIFEPQWKEVILLWLGRPKEEVLEKQKNEFINTLVNFEDELGGFYWFQATFLASAGITEFPRYNGADKIVNKLVEWGFGSFDTVKQKWSKCLDSVAQGARSALIETDHNKVINLLTKQLPTEQDKGREIAKILGQIGAGNSKAIEALIKLLTGNYLLVRHEATESLIRIGVGNQYAINQLKYLLETNLNQWIAILVLRILKVIDYNKKFVIDTLTDLLAPSHDEEIRLRAAQELLDIHNSDSTAITTLIELRHSKNDYIFLRAEDSLCKISARNSTITTALTEQPRCKPKLVSEDKQLWESIQKNRNTAIKIAKLSNKKVIIKWLLNYKDRSLRVALVSKLSELAADDHTIANALVKLIYTSKDEEVHEGIAWFLNKTVSRSENSINALVHLLRTSERMLTQKEAVDSLKTLLHGKLLSLAVTSLRSCLTEQVYKNDFNRYNASYKIIWHCAQNMNYLDFYQAWHNPTSAHPEIQETTAFTSYDSQQSLNISNLPKLINTAIANNSNLNDTIHLICIDSSKFENPDNPASEIYAEMVMQGCPERQNGEPETMQALKVYCQLKCQEVFLIFYEDTSSETPQGFSQTFLTSLSKFHNARRICVVCEQPCNLQTFSPNQPNLVADIVSWIREKMMEE
ncbi:NACHT domain-containing protein [Trichocoleus sp. DQ-U1]|uniref:NACHT C-terminal alpha/beta 1 domain-containing protein n=1 Tax=Trichocoleus sp. DQ-U1 TaxID=2933926 RepID=UPI003298E09E